MPEAYENIFKKCIAPYVHIMMTIIINALNFFTAIASYQTISNFFLIDNIDAVPQHIKIQFRMHFEGHSICV